jgi:hypothetical protein
MITSHIQGCGTRELPGLPAAFLKEKLCSVGIWNLKEQEMLLVHMAMIEAKHPQSRN